MTTIPDIVRDGKLMFFKYGESPTGRNSVRLQIDPTPYILYWRYKDSKVFNTKELAHEKNYIYLERIYDVRIGMPTDFELGPNERNYEKNFLTVVSGTSITNLKFTHFVYLGTNEKKLREFADSLFKIVLQVKREEHGLLYHFRKKLAPKMYAAFTQRCLEEDIMRAFDKHKKNSTKNEWTAVGKLLSVNSQKNIEIDDQKLIKIIMILTKFEGSRLEAIFRKISKDEPAARRLEFGEWVRKNQHDHRLNDARFPSMSDTKVDSILKSWKYAGDSAITPQIFTHWFASDECGVAISSQRMKLDVASMREPINRYFINSSHNTYCSGNQLVYAIGHCSADVEMYRQALLSGSRCVELDVWDNKDKDGDPVITHGPTAVMGMNEIGLKEVCKAIKECAFKTTPYPLILSIENHLGRRQQEKMVQIFHQVFGDLLLTGPLSEYPLFARDGSGGDVVYPPPEFLKYKILIKAKKKRFEKQESRCREDSSIDLHGSAIDLTEDEAIENARFNELTEEQKAAQMTQLPEETSCSELSAIINYMQAYESSRGSSTAANLENAALDCVPCIVSADENTVWNCLRGNFVEKVQRLSKSKIMRIYPKASRIYSTNYNPMIHWLTGAQMVALNIQTNCANMQLNYSMFDRNGGCGYVRKPDWLRARDVQLKPFLSIPYTIAYTVEVEVIAAYFLSAMDSEKYRRRSTISVRLFDVPDQIQKGDVSKPSLSSRLSENSCKRRAREETSFVTNYERHVYSFDKVMLNDMSFVQFNVHNESGSVFAQRILHIDTMNNGYRFVTLRTPANQCAGPACLLVRFDLFIHSDRTNLNVQKQMYDPHAFERESDKWKRRFSNPFADTDALDQGNDFLLVDGTRRGSVEHAPTTPTTPTKPTSFGRELLEKFAFWKKK